MKCCAGAIARPAVICLQRASEAAASRAIPGAALPKQMLSPVSSSRRLEKAFISQYLAGNIFLLFLQDAKKPNSPCQVSALQILHCAAGLRAVRHIA